MPRCDELSAALIHSHDIIKYRRAFYDAAKKLIDDGVTDVETIREFGGWCKSEKPDLYFMLVGEMRHISEKWYVNVTTGKVFQRE